MKKWTDEALRAFLDEWRKTGRTFKEQGAAHGVTKSRAQQLVRRAVRVFERNLPGWPGLESGGWKASNLRKTPEERAAAHEKSPGP